jgi:hypothetical protein
MAADGKRRRYPQVRVESLHSPNPFVLIAAVRQGLRRAGVAHDEIELFSSQALEHRDPEGVLRVCTQWVDVDPSLLADR